MGLERVFAHGISDNAPATKAGNGYAMAVYFRKTEKENVMSEYKPVRIVNANGIVNAFRDENKLVSALLSGRDPKDNERGEIMHRKLIDQATRMAAQWNGSNTIESVWVEN